MSNMSNLKSQLTVGLFQSLSFCGLRQKVLKNIAFQPPKVSYSFKLRDGQFEHPKICSLKQLDLPQEIRQKSKSYDDDNLIQSGLLDIATEILQSSSSNSGKMLENYPAYDFYLIDSIGREIPIPKQENMEITGYFLYGRKGHKTASLFLQNLELESEYVLLFSHGNASDLGYMIDTLIDLCNNLRINIFAYEYSGYGLSTGKCNDLNIINNIQSAYEFVINELKFDSTKVIVYGYSIGSGPSVMLVSDQQYPVGGLVVHSGLSSGLRVISNKIISTPFYDLFPNVDRIREVTCPVFIMHGTSDEVIDFDHAKQLAQNCQRLYEFWEVDGIGHSGIDTDNDHRKPYFYKLRSFIKLIQDENYNVKELKQRNTASPKIGYKHYYDNKLKDFHLNPVKVEDISYHSSPCKKLR